MTTARLMSLLTMKPQSIGDIAEACNVSRREVELAVEDARKAGRPIVANGRGIYLASSLADLIAYERSTPRTVIIWLATRFRSSARRRRER